MSLSTKLTSVNILEPVYKKFKIKSIEESINLQKVVNRALDLYIKDDEFRNKINNHKEIMNGSSRF